jgi:peptidoglycan/LPS O-acetylase OafA/YrhL
MTTELMKQFQGDESRLPSVPLNVTGYPGVSRPEIPTLTSLRFFAALIVVIFHYDRKLELFPAGLSDFGYDAVTFFFILSGFILTYVHAAESSSEPKLNVDTRTFITARLARILPAYFLALVLSGPFFISGFIKHDTELVLFVLGIVLVPVMAQAWVPEAALLWNGPAWSLSNELCFYLIYPTLWVCTKRLSGLPLLLLAFVVILAVEVLRACLPGTSSAMHDFSAYFPLLNLPQFVLGIALATIFIRKLNWRSTNYELLLGIGLTAVVLAIAFKQDVPILGNTALLSIFFASVVFGAAGAQGRLSRYLSLPALVMLGESSYALYILHVPIWQWWYWFNHVYLQNHNYAACDFALYLTTIVCVVLLIFVYVERPARRWIRMSTRLRGKFLASAGADVCLGGGEGSS